MTNSTLNSLPVLVTGANGFIGSHLVDALLETGADVHLLARAGTADAPHEESSTKTHEANFYDIGSLARAVGAANPKIIFHLAASVNASRNHLLAREMINSNLIVTMNLLRALELAGVKYEKFVNTDTSEVYGDNPVPFTEDMPLKPVSPYSASKAAATTFCGALHKASGAPITTLRLAPTYGPRQKIAGMLIPNLIYSCLTKGEFKTTKGEQTRDFTYVSDVVGAYLAAAACPEADGQVINISCGAEHIVKDTILKIVELMGWPIQPQIGALPYRPGDVMHFFCDNSKAKKLLGWQPHTQLEDGLRKTISWHKEKFERGELENYVVKR